MKCKDCNQEGCPNRCYTEGAECIYSNPPIQPCFDNTFNWLSFRAEAAKDILCVMISGAIISGAAGGLIKEKGNFVKVSIEIADELIKQLKEREEE